VKIAICICTCARPNSLQRLLDALSGIEFGALDPRDIHFVVIDNRPGGRAREICNKALERLPVALHFVEEPTPGISFARNRAITVALDLGVAWIAFLDDDDLPKSDWLLRLINRQLATDADVVLGVWQLPDNFKVPQLLREFDFFKPPRIEAINNYGLPSFAGTFNVLLRGVMIEQLSRSGPVFLPVFAFTGGGDTEFFVRAHRAGWCIVVAEDSVIVRHWEPDRVTLRGALRRSFRHGVSEMLINRRHLPPSQCKQIQRRSLKKLYRSMLRLMNPTISGRRRFSIELQKIASHMGRIYADAGGRYRYYR
jgi:GT2 family glycosyltransferase